MFCESNKNKTIEPYNYTIPFCYAGLCDVEDEGAREEAAGDATESRGVPLAGHQGRAQAEDRTHQVAQRVPVTRQ